MSPALYTTTVAFTRPTNFASLGPLLSFHSTTKRTVVTGERLLQWFDEVGKTPELKNVRCAQPSHQPSNSIQKQWATIHGGNNRDVWLKVANAMRSKAPTGYVIGSGIDEEHAPFAALIKEVLVRHIPFHARSDQ